MDAWEGIMYWALNGQSLQAHRAATALMNPSITAGSRSAAADSPGAARIRITAMARTPDGTESACALLSALPFSAAGRLTCDLSQSLSPLSDVLYPTAILPTDYDAFGEILAQTG
jgi:hypothetical protein